MEIGKHTALLIIDLQEGLRAHPAYGQKRNNPDAEERAGQLLRAWRKHGLPLFHIKHLATDPKSPLFPGKPGNAFRDEVAPLRDETVIRKKVNCAFVNTDLETRLREEGVSDLLLTGMVTEHCVAATAMTAANLGFRVYLVEDAIATFERRSLGGTPLTASQVHDYMLSFLHEEFASVVSSGYILDKMG